MVDMGLNSIVNNYREPQNDRIINAWIKDWESDILITLEQGNEQHLLHKYKNIRFFDDEDNQTYMIAPEIWSLKGPTEGISIIFWLGGSLIGGMRIIWTN